LSFLFCYTFFLHRIIIHQSHCHMFPDLPFQRDIQNHLPVSNMWRKKTKLLLAATALCQLYLTSFAIRFPMVYLSITLSPNATSLERPPSLPTCSYVAPLKHCSTTCLCFLWKFRVGHLWHCQ
jgi:hypothetical protein